MAEVRITVEDKDIIITHPEKILWPEHGKMAYIQYLLAVAPYLLPYTHERLLMMWIYPHGIDGKRIEKRSRPKSAPSWLRGIMYKEKPRIFLNDAATLAWVANYGALELHVPFDRYRQTGYPTELVFDLDPAGPDDFELVLEVANRLHLLLDSLGLFSVPKTSGATGLQIHLPIEPKYTFAGTRQINKFIAEYMFERMPQQLTLDRVVSRRGARLYFDYLQLWSGRTMPAPYSVRARAFATVATPLTWDEVADGFRPQQFTVLTIPGRLQAKGDLFSPITTQKGNYSQPVDEILSFVKCHIKG